MKVNKNELKQRLKNIKEVAEKMFDGNYNSDGIFAAITFIIGEADINLNEKSKDR